MDWDVVDALTMLPGLVGAHIFAWQSDDFVYRVAVLSWGWCCLCSMLYHLKRCDPEYLKYDMRAQWVSQVFMILGTPQSSWPIIVGGLLTDNYWLRVVLNGMGAFYFLWHLPVARYILLLSYAAYALQFPTGMKWLHSVFHLLLHVAGGMAALNPVKKYTIGLHPVWAWPVFWVGARLLLPVKKIFNNINGGG
jgi:hypothetical protein